MTSNWKIFCRKFAFKTHFGIVKESDKALSFVLILCGDLRFCHLVFAAKRTLLPALRDGVSRINL